MNACKRLPSLLLLALLVSLGLSTSACDSTQGDNIDVEEPPAFASSTWHLISVTTGGVTMDAEGAPRGPQVNFDASGSDRTAAIHGAGCASFEGTYRIDATADITITGFTGPIYEVGAVIDACGERQQLLDTRLLDGLKRATSYELSWIEGVDPQNTDYNAALVIRFSDGSMRLERKAILP